MPSQTAEMTLHKTSLLEELFPFQSNSTIPVNYTGQLTDDESKQLTYDNFEKLHPLKNIEITFDEYNINMRNLTVQIINRYYLLSAEEKTNLLSDIIYDDNFFYYLIDFPFTFNLDTEKTEIIKILLTHFPKEYFEKIIVNILNNNRSIFQRLFLVELIPFLEQYDNDERIKKLYEIQSKISDKHINSFIQETIETLKE